MIDSETKYWPIVLDELALKAAAEVLEKYPKVTAAWLFGSQATGLARADSDVDIAVFSENPLNLHERLEIAGELERVLAVERVDLVPLASSQPVLAFEAICGKPILNRDPGARAAFVSLISRAYEDVMANLERGLSYRQQVWAREA